MPIKEVEDLEGTKDDLIKDFIKKNQCKIAMKSTNMIKDDIAKIFLITMKKKGTKN